MSSLYLLMAISRHRATPLERSGRLNYSGRVAAASWRLQRKPSRSQKKDFQ
jgi:hypothetical protein